MLSIKRILIAMATFACVGAGLLFFLPRTPPALPERPPTFDEIMTLFNKGMASNSLIDSYIYGQDDRVAFKSVMARARTGDLKADMLACHMLVRGVGIVRNDALGYAFCERAAEKGSPNGKAYLIYRDYDKNPDLKSWIDTRDAFTALLNTAPSIGHGGLQLLYRPESPYTSMPMMFYHLERAVAHDNTFAMHDLSKFDLLIYPEEYRDPARAEKNLKKAYALNNFDAGHRLALEYRDGDLIEKDVARYETMIKRMAAFLHPDSMGTLAYMHATGNGAALDEAKSNALHIKAAAWGSKFSQETIAYHFLFGPEEDRDFTTGVRYLTRPAEDGKISAMIGLSRHYGRPEIDDPDNQHVAWLAKAAIQGSERAQDELGFGMMETGYIEQMQPYIRFLEDGHAAGDPNASFLLARHYRAASGVTRDLWKAINILQAAAHFEHPKIIEELDVVKGYIIHFGGIGAVPDIIEL